MSRTRDGYAANTLKTVSYHLSSVPAQQLPTLIPHIAAILPACEPVLSAPHNSSANEFAETGVPVHRFRTRVSALLQDRSVERRWSGVVLVKSAIELGGWEMLHKSGAWVRGLLGILTKPDPPTTKTLAVITLTRIFMLTRDYQNLVREITTPALTPYIVSCVNILSNSKSIHRGTPELATAILESFARLLPRHPATFRPHLSKINKYLSVVIAQSSADVHALLGAEGLDAARSLYAQLPNCAAKHGCNQEWEETLQNIIIATHQTADKVLRAVVEEWESAVGIQPPNTLNQTVEHPLQQMGVDKCGFPGWIGFHAGASRLIGLLELTAKLIASTTPSTGSVHFPIAYVMDLLTRLLSTTAPAGHDRMERMRDVKFNAEIGKEERNDLFAMLPEVHLAALRLFETVIKRFGRALSPVIGFLLELVTVVFQEEMSLTPIRGAAYSVLSRCLPIIGSSLPPHQVKSLNLIMYSCCEDLLPQEIDAAQKARPATAKDTKAQALTPMNADGFLSTSKTKGSQTAVRHKCYESAYELLPLLLTQLPVRAMHNSVRVRIDSTAVLIRHEQALLASVLSLDPRGNPSVLPLLARMYPESAAVEALLRPRVPIVKGNVSDSLDVAREESEDDEDETKQEVLQQGSVGSPDQTVPINNVQQDMTVPTMVPLSRPVEPIAPHIQRQREESPISESEASFDELHSAGKRPSMDMEVYDGSSKRLRADTPPTDVQRPEAYAPSVLPCADELAPVQMNYGEDYQDDSSDVEVPPLVMGIDESSEGE